MNFEKWLTQIGKSEKTAKNYAQAIDKSISKWARDAGLIDSSLALMNNAGQLGELRVGVVGVQFLRLNAVGRELVGGIALHIVRQPAE